MEGWVEGRESGVKDCLQQSKISTGKFNKGGNCKLQEGISFQSKKLAQVNSIKRGNCKVQFPQMPKSP